MKVKVETAAEVAETVLPVLIVVLPEHRRLANNAFQHTKNKLTKAPGVLLHKIQCSSITIINPGAVRQEYAEWLIELRTIASMRGIPVFELVSHTSVSLS